MLVSLAAGFHLFPFRTESLSLPALMVLGLMPRESKSMPTQYNTLALPDSNQEGLRVLRPLP